MQSSYTTDDLCQEENPCNQHRPLKLVRSHDIDHDKQQRLPFRKNRSVSSSLRHSIRHLTSCGLARRKTGRITDRDNHGTSVTETTTAFDDEHQQSSKTLLIPTTYSLSSSHKKANSYKESSIQSTNCATPPNIPSHKPLDKKHSVQTPSTTSSTTLALSQSSQEQSSINDDKPSSNTRRLSGKEISTSLGNLMGTATDTMTVNNTTQMPIHQSRPRKNSVLSLLQHISATSAATVDRLGLLQSSSSNAGSPGMVESPLSPRTAFAGNTYSNNSSPGSFAKLTNEVVWCNESSTPSANNGRSSLDECVPQLEIDNQPLTYRQQFESTEHFNWYSTSDIHGPVIVSYKYSTDQDRQRYVMGIVRTRQGTSIETLSDIPSSYSSIDILRRLCDQRGINDVEYFDPILCDGTHDFLMKYDESHVSNTHKFGIIYQRANQVTEEDIFGNETHSKAMDNFLDLIGTRVKLKDFPRFRGGLDIKADHTGTESVYEQFNNNEIMFHVSTLLPHSKIERQQLERKRHIGNDIVAIVFQETETIFNPECIASKFLHVYLVITPLDADGTRLKVSVIHRDGVPPFGPQINSSNSFSCDKEFKQWILTKLINAEMASCRASSFQKYQERTKMTLFDNLYRTLHDNNCSLMKFILHHSQYKHECELEQQREDTQAKTYDRQVDTSLLGSVKRRLIAPKLWSQSSSTPPPAAIIISTPPSNSVNDTKSKARSMTMDLKQSSSRESMMSNGSSHGKMTSLFSSSLKSHSPRLEKSNTNRSLLEAETADSSLNSRSSSKFLSPTTFPSPPNSDSNLNSDPCQFGTAFNFSKLSVDDTDHDNQTPLSSEDLQSSSKDDLIKYVLALHRYYSTKLTQTDQKHSKAMKQLQMRLTPSQNVIDGENL